MSFEMKLGGEPKKTAAFVILLAIAGGIYFFYGGSSQPAGSETATKTETKAAPRAPALSKDAQAADPDAATASAPSAGKAASRDFRPTLKHKAGAAIDPEHFDPALRTDLLAKLAAVRVEHVERSLFDFSGGPAAAGPAKPKQPEPKIVLKPRHRIYGPAAPPPPAPPAPPAVKPPPPAIALKFYGRSLPARGASGVKRVFCLVNNDEVLSPTEGDVILKRYKIHRITATTVLVEDLEYKNQQTLPIEAPTPGGA
jgi:hypothetical protein